MNEVFEASDPAELESIAPLILDALGDSDIVLFQGEMGAGKTTLIKVICRTLGVNDLVNSPTFSIVNEYLLPNGDSLYHFDLYRIEKAAELSELGFEEYLYSGNKCFIEWPEKAEGVLPDHSKTIEITVENGKRIIRVR